MFPAGPFYSRKLALRLPDTGRVPGAGSRTVTAALAHYEWIDAHSLLVLAERHAA
jgi:hypothetical protein